MRINVHGGLSTLFSLDKRCKLSHPPHGKGCRSPLLLHAQSNLSANGFPKHGIYRIDHLIRNLIHICVNEKKLWKFLVIIESFLHSIVFDLDLRIRTKSHKR
jgi:hypothetical protein